MKKVFFAFVAVVLGLSVNAQELTDAQKAAADAAAAISNAPKSNETLAPKPRYWKNSVSTKIDFGQTSLTNWAAGGYNTYSLKAFIDANANYAKDKMFWNNRLQLDYGFLYSADKPVLQKSDDRIYLESKWGYKMYENLSFSAEYSFKSQFSNTWSYPKSLPEGSDEGDPKVWKENRSLKSGFVSPAYTNLALGIDYKPLKWLSVNFAPLTGGFVIVDLPQLRKGYSMKLKDEDKTVPDYTLPENPTNQDKQDYNIAEGKLYRSAKFEFGAQLKVDVAVKVNDNFKYSSQILLFSDYLDHPEQIRVNWDNRIEWKLAKYFSLMFTTNLIYDDKVMIKNDKDLDKYPDGKARVQFKESLSFGFVYTIASKN